MEKELALTRTAEVRMPWSSTLSLGLSEGEGNRTPEPSRSCARERERWLVGRLSLEG